MAETKKVLGWGRCTVKNAGTSYNDMIENSTQLSVEEGQEQEATIEGGTAEGRKKAPDKYTLTHNRRIGNASEVEVGYTEDAGDVEVIPENVGAVGVKMTGVSKHVAVKYDTTDGLVAVTTYKTKGATDDEGNLTDITFPVKAASSGS